MISINLIFGFILSYTSVIYGFYVLTQDYDSAQVGWSVIWAAFTMPFIASWQKRFDHRLLLLIGVLAFCGSGLINSNLTRMEAGNDLVFSQVLRAFGQTFILWPLWAMTILEVKPVNYEEAAKIYTLSRVIGTTLGLAAIGGFATWRMNFHSTHVTESLTDSVLKRDITQMKHYFLVQGAGRAQSSKQAVIAVVRHVRAETAVLTYSDEFWLVGCSVCLAIIPLLFVRGRPGGRSIVDVLFSQKSDRHAKSQRV
jgi:DHA2 family multidrug resistance protein